MFHFESVFDGCSNPMKLGFHEVSKNGGSYLPCYISKLEFTLLGVKTH